MDDQTSVDDDRTDETAMEEADRSVDDGSVGENPGSVDEKADGGYVDELPADLDATAVIGVYEFPNNAKRRVASILYLVVGAICIWLGFGVESALVNGGMAAVGIGLVAFAVYSYVFAVETRYDETDALVAAAAITGMRPGHSAAQMTWRGFRSRPVWRILMFSDEEQPLHRAIVLVDGVTGEVLEHFVEDNPEDWSQL